MNKPLIYRFIESVAVQMEVHTPGQIQPLPPLTEEQQALFDAAGEHIVASREAEYRGDAEEARRQVTRFKEAFLTFLATLPDAE